MTKKNQHLTQYQRIVLRELTRIHEGSCRAITDKLKMKSQTVCGILNRLIELDMIHFVRTEQCGRTKHYASIYRVGSNPDLEVDTCAIRRINSKSWTPHLVRDPLALPVEFFARTA